MKKNLFVLALGLIILSACGGQPVAEKKGEKISGSIEDLIARNKNLKCELMVNNGADIISGTTYISGKQARSDYKTKMDAQTVNGHMINDGTWLYTWMDEFPEQAMKIKLDSMESASLLGNQQAEDSGLGNYEDKMDYDCYNWSKDDSLLTPPKGINFIDYTSMMESAAGMMNGLGTGNDIPDLNNDDKSSLCGACDSVTDATAKTMCKQRLGCK